jgi:hypothetical protein
MLYLFGRFWFENMRIDPAHHVTGLRINALCRSACFSPRSHGSSGWEHTSRSSDTPLPCNHQMRERIGDALR